MSDAPDLQRRGTSTGERAGLLLALIEQAEQGEAYLLSGYARVADDLKGVCSPFLCGLLSSGGHGRHGSNGKR